MDKQRISDEALENIKKLSVYLREMAANQNQKNDTGFNIQHFCKGLNSKNECGSTACAVGHFAIMTGNEVTDDGVTTPSGQFLTWMQYSKSHIGLNASVTQSDSIFWDWFFGGGWSEVDNTPLGVVARIEHYLEHGIPRNFIISNSSAKYNYTMVDEYLERRIKLESETEQARSTHA